jgi:hypothetical protein
VYGRIKKCQNKKHIRFYILERHHLSPSGPTPAFENSPGCFHWMIEGKLVASRVRFRKPAALRPHQRVFEKVPTPLGQTRRPGRQLPTRTSGRHFARRYPRRFASTGGDHWLLVAEDKLSNRRAELDLTNANNWLDRQAPLAVTGRFVDLLKRIYFGKLVEGKTPLQIQVNKLWDE